MRVVIHHFYLTNWVFKKKQNVDLTTVSRGICELLYKTSRNYDIRSHLPRSRALQKGLSADADATSRSRASPGTSEVFHVHSCRFVIFVDCSCFQRKVSWRSLNCPSAFVCPLRRRFPACGSRKGLILSVVSGQIFSVEP